MTSAPTSEITGLLVDWSNGDQAALDKLLPLVEQELHRLRTATCAARIATTRCKLRLS